MFVVKLLCFSLSLFCLVRGSANFGSSSENDWNTFSISLGVGEYQSYLHPLHPTTTTNVPATKQHHLDHIPTEFIMECYEKARRVTDKTAAFRVLKISLGDHGGELRREGQLWVAIFLFSQLLKMDDPKLPDCSEMHYMTAYVNMLHGLVDRFLQDKYSGHKWATQSFTIAFAGYLMEGRADIKVVYEEASKVIRNTDTS